jgi:hypothetical protein
MRRHVGKAAVAAALFALLALAAPAQAARPMLGVHIDSPVALFEPGQPGSFSASGPAVDAGVICPGGTVSATELRQVRPDWILTTKQFTCDDGSGEFHVSLWVSIPSGGPVGDSVFRWQVIPSSYSTGAYTHLVGKGQGSGEIEGDVVFDVYDGEVLLPGR